MNRKSVFLVIISIFLICIPIVNANAPSHDLLPKYRIEGKGVVVPEGYWVFGKVQNGYIAGNMENVVVEVTLLDASGSALDVVTSPVVHRIIEREMFGAFVAKSPTQEEVAEIKYKLQSNDETDNIAFLYLELSQIVITDTGVDGRLTNTHKNQWVEEAEVIVSFQDTKGTVVDMQTWGANGYGRFNAEQSETFSISTAIEHDSVTINVQCNRESRYMYPRLIVDRPNKVMESWTPPIGETIILGIQDDPEYIWSGIDVLLTDPLGNANTVQFQKSGLLDYRYTITPKIPGVWNVTWEWDQFASDGGYTIVEAGVFNSGFFTWDPSAEATPTGNVTDPADPIDIGSILNSTGISSDMDDLNTTASEIIDSVTTKADELVENLPEEIKRQIPGFPIISVMAAFSVVYLLFSRKN